MSTMRHVLVSLAASAFVVGQASAAAHIAPHIAPHIAAPHVTAPHPAAPHIAEPAPHVAPVHEPAPVVHEPVTHTTSVVSHPAPTTHGPSYFWWWLWWGHGTRTVVVQCDPANPTPDPKCQRPQ